MTKSKTKSKKLAKGVALGFATVLTTASMPIGSVLALAEEWKGDQIVSNTTSIQVGEASQSTETFVTKGQTVTIPQGEYYSKGSSTAHIIGSDVSGTITKSRVYVTYVNGTEVAKNGNTFVADRIGTYTITYAVVDNGALYTYDIKIECEASEAAFEFASNDQNILPSVYDVAIAKDKDGNVKDIVLPLPSVNDENGDEILSSDAENFTTSKSILGGKSSYVEISITNGDEDLKVIEKDGKFIVKTTDYEEGVNEGHITNALKGKEYTINYSFYEVKDAAKVFVASTTKTFTVKDGYYKTSKATNAENGFELVAELSTKPDSAVVGVEKTLPTVSATTKAENSPASESVDIYYELKVYTTDENGKFNVDVTNDVINEDGKFVANAEGDYYFEYIVHDFYGHDNTSSKATTSFTIKNVKDTKSPEVFMYDAGTHSDTDVENKEFTVADTIFKSKAVNRNIIMYAIGGKDNLPTNTLTLRREIHDANVTRFSIEEQAYNAYNLIFAPTAGDGTDVWKQIVADNYEIERQMILSGTNIEDSGEIQAWLKAHKYLLVTMDGKNLAGEAIVEDLTSDDAVEQLIEAGYAYCKPVTSNTSSESGNTYTFSEKATYTFYYWANDNKGNAESKETYSIYLEKGYSDNSAPVINFPSTLQESYLREDTITFKAITADNVSDNSVDGDPVVGTAYRYLISAGETPVAVDEGGTETLQYYIKGNTNEEFKNKYFFKDFSSGGTTGLFSQNGWHIVKDSTAKLNLKDAPSSAGYLEILAYAIDDYGNIGFYNKVVEISGADAEIPVLVKVTNAPSSSDTFTAPNSITLPTLQFSDDKVTGMHAKVSVYKVSGSGEDTTHQAYSVSGMKTSYDVNRETFTVDAGTFNASTGGDYQVVVTVVDSANHSYSTYFNYHVRDYVIVEDPEISNISTETKELEIGKTEYLAPPTISVNKSEAYGYIGLSDTNNATDYYPQVISASSSDYSLDQYYFSASTSGTYKIKYFVRLLRYSKDSEDFAETLTENKLSLEGEKLVYQTGSQKYYVYIEDGELHANTDVNGTGSELGDRTRLNQIVKAFPLESSVITISVKQVVIDVTMPDEAYKKTDFPDIDSSTPSIEILKPNASVRGDYELDKENSTVTITYSSNTSSSEQVAKFSLADWENATNLTEKNEIEVSGEKINLLLKRTGEYKISYSIQAKDKYGASVGDPKALNYTIKSGDNVKPEIEFTKKDIKTEYAVGESLKLTFAADRSEDVTEDAIKEQIKNIFDLSDNTTAVKDLISSLEVTIKGPDGTKTLTNEAEDTTKNFEFNYTFETAGDYTLTFKVKDKAGNYETDTISFTVKAKEAKTTDVKQVLGGVLIGVSVALLAAVVVYFIISKVKLDKKERSYKRK